MIKAALHEALPLQLIQIVCYVSTAAEVQSNELNEATLWKLQTPCRPVQQTLYFDLQLRPPEHQG